jgi:hypothetical protein
MLYLPDHPDRLFVGLFDYHLQRPLEALYPPARSETFNQLSGQRTRIDNLNDKKAQPGLILSGLRRATSSYRWKLWMREKGDVPFWGW